MLTYYRLPWPDAVVPPESPLEMLYEVQDEDVLKTVEIFADGRSERDSVESQAAVWGEFPSLIDVPWSEMKNDVPDLQAHSIGADEFERLWSSAADRIHTPFLDLSPHPAHNARLPAQLRSRPLPRRSRQLLDG